MTRVSRVYQIHALNWLVSFKIQSLNCPWEVNKKVFLNFLLLKGMSLNVNSDILISLINDQRHKTLKNFVLVPDVINQCSILKDRHENN